MQLLNSHVTLLIAAILSVSTNAFAPLRVQVQVGHASRSASGFAPLHMSEETKPVEPEVTEEEDTMDAGTKLQLEKQKRADELRSQEVFMKRSTGIHKCSTCDWEYDEKKGDSYMIGGMIKPDTPFDDLPSNYRCPTCRASKDNFLEVTEEIPGFEVNQGYGLGGNSMTSGQKSGIVFGGLGIFFLLFLGGYGLS
jgi:rubredoxin